MKKLRVVIVGNLPKPLGGVATHCYYLSQELVKQGVDVIFIDTHLNKEKFIPSGVKYFAVTFSIKDICQNVLRPILLTTIFRAIIKFKQYAGFREIFMTIKTCLKIIDVGRKYNIDIIHTQHCLLRALAAVIAGKFLKKATITTIHGAEITHNSIFIKYQGPIEYNARETNAIISVSQFTKRRILERAIAQHVHVIPNGVDVNKYYPISEISKEKNEREKKIVLSVAQLSKRKGIDVLLRSIPLLNYTNVEVWIIGPPGDAKKDIHNLVKQLSIEDKVIFGGIVADKDMVVLYNKADIFVLPTIWETEGFGLVSLEAMSCGIPVVASKIGGIPEVVKDGKTGLLVPPNEPEELAKAINLLLNNRKLLNDMGSYGREIAVKEFLWVRVAERSAKLYRDVINSWKRK